MTLYRQNQEESRSDLSDTSNSLLDNFNHMCIDQLDYSFANLFYSELFSSFFTFRLLLSLFLNNS